LSGSREVRGNRLSDSYALLNTLNAKLNPICHLLALLGAHHILHVGRIRVKDVVHQFVLSFRISWAVWMKLDNYGFRETPKNESQTSFPKE
jgi:hypothetical protein